MARMKRTPEALTDRLFDLLVLGGGITGAGVALDAVTRGLSVALIDKGDFASGTSSISSKLVHGGLRYLEQGAVGLVYEALHERTRLLRHAPHLVWPLRFLLPFRQGDRVPPWKWRIGLLLYDVLAGSGNLRRSERVSPAQLQRDFPDLRRHGLLGGAVFADAQMDDARLVIAVLRSAWLRGAVVVNHVEAVGFEHAGGVIHAVQAIDHLSGRPLRIRARLVVNATGPWADAVRGLAGEREPLLAPTRGVHLIAPGQGRSAGLFLLHPRDGRVFFVLPWLGKTLIGTTDTDSTGPPEALTVTDEEIDYLLGGYNDHFDRPLSRADLLGSFVGVRPLIQSRPGAPSSRSREYEVLAESSGLLSVVGGKYTTYRHMAERIVDAVVARLGGPRRNSRTRSRALDGTPEEPWPVFFPRTVRELRSGYQLEEASARHLVGRYGTRAGTVAGYALRDPDLAGPLVAGEPDLRAELAYQRDYEMACRPADFLLRRTRLGLFHPELLAQPQLLERFFVAGSPVVP
jgi:glycerol-3-phosphate dehydrogenase